MNTTIIAPSILSADFGALKADIALIEKAGAEWIHCDIMDGHFVPNISYGPMIVDQVNKMTDLPLDVHLMITEPMRYLEQFAKAGADIITVHADACENLEATIDKIHELGCKAGVAVNPDKEISLFSDLLPKIDMVLIMSVYAGFGGQSFIPDVMKKVSAVAALVKEQALTVDIQVDGGVNGETAKVCREAGANVLVAGSYVFGGEDYKQRVDSLR
jgi:ribulose-phosphate 3-epimerase